MRQREGVGSAPRGTSLLPAFVSTDEHNDSFHDPDSLLCEGEHPLKDGQQVGGGGRCLDGFRARKAGMHAASSLFTLSSYCLFSLFWVSLSTASIYLERFLAGCCVLVWFLLPTFPALVSPYPALPFQCTFSAHPPITVSLSPPLSACYERFG